MIKDDLIFNWQRRETHPGYKVTAVVLVVLIFTFLFGMVNVRMKPVRTPVVETASVLHFGNDGMGRLWRLRAEEEGPFPGRLQIEDGDDVLDLREMGGLTDSSGWSDYRAKLMPFQTDVGEGSADGLSPKGRRFFPGRVGSHVTGPVESREPSEKHAVKRLPILTPYSREAQQWMPEALPQFDLAIKEDSASASWRFVLSLREDGSVQECVTLSGGEDEGLRGMCEWLSGLKFKEGEGERWFGLRVEFINQ